MTSQMLSKNNVLSQAAYDRYAKLNLGNKVVITYVMIDCLFENPEVMRTKVRIVEKEPASIDDVDIIATACASNADNLHEPPCFEEKIVPVALFKDPFLGDPHKLVFSEMVSFNDKPSRGNHRPSCLDAMEKAKDQHPWFGFEQEYHFVETDKQLLGWPKNGYPGPLGPSFEGVGAGRVFGRLIVESHMRACLYAGVKLGGTNAEAVPSQWEYQIGPCEGIEAADHIWMARYLLERVAEDFGVAVSFKPVQIREGDWFPTGGHCNFSTKAMREGDNCMQEMEKAIEKLSLRNAEHLKVYDPSGGEENRKRLGELVDKFTYGIADRFASVRIPEMVSVKKCGYIEDRRPSSNCCPYLVTEILVRTICLDE